VPELWAAARFHAAAKNIAQAPEFGREAYEVVSWMRSQTNLGELYQQAHSKIWAGVHRLNGRYLSEGGQPGKALRSYANSFLAYPPTVFQDWKRIVFTRVFSVWFQSNWAVI